MEVWIKKQKLIIDQMQFPNMGNLTYSFAVTILLIILSMPAHTKTYGERAENAKNPTAKQLLLTMERKKTNLAVSVDVAKSRDLLNIIEAVGPYVCLIKAKLFFITSSCTCRI